MPSPTKHRPEILAVNLEAPAALIAAAAPGMKARRGGRIVNVSSVSAFTGHPDLWCGITKAGLLNLTKSWARALGPYGIVVNAVAPGPTKTAMYDQLPQSRRDDVMRAIYSGRVCEPAEVAAAIFWLGSSSPIVSSRPRRPWPKSELPPRSILRLKFSQLAGHEICRPLLPANLKQHQGIHI
jgi:3-oxoacyl-[acyl-carrier protein] reductase